jgi:hypothetical protein
MGRMNEVAHFTTETYEPRKALLLSAWLSRELPPRDYLLGNVLCTTSRWIVYGETGVGKTLFAVDVAGAVSSGCSLLNWTGNGRRAKVMYFDGEMPAETFKERMELVAERYGPDLKLYGYNREVLGDGEMRPLNTPDGEKWLWKELDAIKPDLIIFDSIMCLLVGSMSEEESWAPVKPLVRQISSRRIAQIWLHHTGHDASKGFGTKTREWEMDTVISLTKADEGSEAIMLDFKKARLRTPQTRDHFETRIITRSENGWSTITSAAAKSGHPSKQSSEQRDLMAAILKTYNRLADAVGTSLGLDGTLVRKVSLEKLTAELKACGFLPVNEKGQITSTGRTQLRRAKLALLAREHLIERDDQIWR